MAYYEKLYIRKREYVGKDAFRNAVHIPDRKHVEILVGKESRNAEFVLTRQTDRRIERYAQARAAEEDRLVIDEFPFGGYILRLDENLFRGFVANFRRIDGLSGNGSI